MSKADLNYAQIEKEMLSLVFAVRKFHQYIYGKDLVVIENDHKLLETIMKKTMDKVPPRLQRMMLNLLPYDLHVHYVPGKFMYLADMLSRAYLPIQNADHKDQEIGYVVHSIIKNFPITTQNLKNFEKPLPVIRHYRQPQNTVQMDGQKPKEMFRPMSENTGIFAIRSTFPKALFSLILALLFILNRKLKCLRLFMKVISA